MTDLAGKRIGIVTGSEATAGLLELVLGHYGVPLDKVTVTEIASDKVGAAVKDNQFDALFVAGPAIGKAVSNAVAAASRNGMAPSFIAIDQADGIANRNPAFASTEIDAGTFGGTPPAPDDKLTSLSFAEYLVARRSIHESLVATLAKVLYSSRQTLAVAEPGQIKIEAPSTDKDADIVLHPGALAYLSDSQQSFFDKYGDDIFYGLLIFPVFGSGIAAVASFLLRDTRTKRLRLLQRVLDLVRKAHAAQTVQALDQLQIEADNLVIAIIHQSEHEEFDETARMSFSFALDQLRFAIAGRRSAILDRSDTARNRGDRKRQGRSGVNAESSRRRISFESSSESIATVRRIHRRRPHGRRKAEARGADATRIATNRIGIGCDRRARRPGAAGAQFRGGPAANHPWGAVRRRVGIVRHGLGTRRPAFAHAGRSRDHR